jgi:RNA polymerase sigma-70 factor (ECF subfamily)
MSIESGESTTQVSEEQSVAIARPFVSRLVAEGSRLDAVLEQVRSTSGSCRNEADVLESALAAACGLGEQNAIVELLAAHGRMMRMTASNVLRDGDAIDECLQRVRVRLFVGDARGPRIRAFVPGGTLRGWLQTVTMREALMQLRSTPNDKHADEDELASRMSTGDSELDMLKQRYGAELREAFQRAIENVHPNDRRLLREHILEEHSIDDLAERHGISRATAARWVIRARDAVAELVRQDLKAKFQMDTPELESVLRLVRSQVDLSVSTQLRR